MASDSVDDKEGGRARQYSFIDIGEAHSEKVRALYDYWQSLRQGREMPRRTEIDPTAFWTLLKNVFMNEWHTDPERLYYRIAGNELVAALGREVRGKWLTDLYDNPEDVARTLWIYRQAVTSRRPLIGRTDAKGLRIGAKTFEWIICPLSEDGQHVTHFIGLEDYVASRRYLGDPD